MELRSKGKHSRPTLISIVAFTWAFFLVILGTWWVYLLLTLGDDLKKLALLENKFFDYEKFIWMIKWEGGSFIGAVGILSASLYYLIKRDRMKTRSLQKFFAAMTHELKTPLASIRLQAEVIENSYDPQTLKKLVPRLIEDTKNLETQMDKILQLSRIEQDGNLNLKSVHLLDSINAFQKRWATQIELTLPEQEIDIMADEFALELIFRNLFENTKRYGKSNSAEIKINSEGDKTHLTYCDGGYYDGPMKRLGELFYKHNSPKGSGIGLYLIKKIMSKMEGDMEIEKAHPFTIKLTFTNSPESDNG